MPPFNPYYSNHYKVHYKCTGHPYPHSFGVHYGPTPGAPSTTLKDTITAFLSAIQPRLAAGWAVTGAEYRAAGVPTYLPTDPPVSPTASSTVQNKGSFPNYLYFPASSSSGRVTHIQLFGIWANEAADGDIAEDYRIYATEADEIAAAIAALNADSGLITTVDGLQAFWKGYANFKKSAHMVKKLRG